MADLHLQPGAHPANPDYALSCDEAQFQSTSYRTLTPDTLRIIGTINHACRRHRIPVSTFGRRAVGDPRLFSDLMNGRSLRPSTEAKLNAFIVNLGGE